MLRCLPILVCLLLHTLPCVAQVPSVIVLDGSVADRGEAISDGVHRLLVSWYDRAAGGTVLFREEHDVVLQGGRYRVELGRTAGLPTDILRGGHVWLGLSIDGAAEAVPRTPLLPTAYTHRAAHADVADRLAPTVTGVVTSLNELAGPLHLRGDSTIRVDRHGNTLLLSARGKQRLHGVVHGPSAPPIRIDTGTPLAPTASVAVRVEGGPSPIAATIVAIEGSTIVVTTSAALTADEHLRWEVTDAD